MCRINICCCHLTTVMFLKRLQQVSKKVLFNMFRMPLDRLNSLYCYKLLLLHRALDLENFRSKNLPKLQVVLGAIIYRRQIFEDHSNLISI